jgi:SAM-dependent methyltransferase
VPAAEPGDPRLYPLLRCSVCGTAVTGGEPPGPELYEGGAYAPERPRAAGAVEALLRVAAGQPARLLRQAGVPPGARVLDAGAGRGRQLAGLLRAGFDARGIEPSERGHATLEADGLPAARERIEEHEDDGLDAVVLWHVLEHLDGPAAGLARVGSWLRPGGIVLVGVPNVASLQARIAGPGWLHLDAPRHRTHFTPEGLARLLEREGFAPGRARHLVWEHNVASMWMAILTRLGMTPGFPFHLLKRNVEPSGRDLALVALGVPLAPFAAALELAAAAGRHGGTIAVAATRR